MERLSKVVPKTATKSTSFWSSCPTSKPKTTFFEDASAILKKKSAASRPKINDFLANSNAFEP